MQSLERCLVHPMFCLMSRSSAKKAPVKKSWADIVKTGRRKSGAGAKHKSLPKKVIATKARKPAVKRVGGLLVVMLIDKHDTRQNKIENF